MQKKFLLFFPFLILLFLTSFYPAYASQNPTSNRLAGNDRYETAFQIAKFGWQQSDYAILAYGENYPDALAAVPLAKKLNAPILLTDKDSLNPNTSTALKDLKVKTIKIVGGTAVISVDVENQLISEGYSVKRIAGQDRYDTAIKIAEELGDAKEVAVTIGDDYADALSIGPIAAEKQMPIILVPKDDVTSSIQNYISSKIIEKTYVIGDQSLISDNVANKFNNPERILGKDKYERNIAILNQFTDIYLHDKICLATGENFADALAGAVYAANNVGAVVLVKGELPDSTRDFLRKGNSPSSITVFGGEAAVPASLILDVYNNETLDFGTINDRTYTNKYFGLTINLPDWLVADSVKWTRTLPSNKYIYIKDPLNASSYNGVGLLYIKKYYYGQEHNQALKVLATKIDSNIITATTSKDYLTDWKKSYASEYTFPKDIYTEKISGIDFNVLECKLINSNSISLGNNMKIYAAFKKGYLLEFVEEYTDDTDTTDVNKILSSVQFNP